MVESSLTPLIDTADAAPSEQTTKVSTPAVRTPTNHVLNDSHPVAPTSTVGVQDDATNGAVGPTVSDIPTLNCSALQLMLEANIRSDSNGTTLVCADNATAGATSRGISKCVLLRVFGQDMHGLFTPSVPLPSDTDGVLLYQHRKPFDEDAENDALNIRSPHLIRRWGVCDVVNTTTIKFARKRVYVSDLLPTVPSSSVLHALHQIEDFSDPYVDPDPCKRLRVAYSIVDSVRALMDRGLPYYDWKFNQWAFTNTGRVVLVDIAGVRNETFYVEHIHNNKWQRRQRTEAEMLALIKRFWMRGQTGQHGYQAEFALKLQADIAQAREQARKRGTEPISISSHISRAKLAQTALLASQTLVLTRRPEVLITNAKSETDRSIFRNASTWFQRIQEGLAVDTMGTTNGAVETLIDAIGGLLIGSCDGIDDLNRDLRPHIESDSTSASTGLSISTASAKASVSVPRQTTASATVPPLHRLSTTPTRLYVVSLDGVAGADPRNEGRLKNMSADWGASCPNDPIDFVVCPGIQHPVRGRGVTIAFTLCLDRAIKDGNNDA